MASQGPESAFESATFGQNLSFSIKQPVGSMSISPCGRDVVLASKEGLHIIDLDFPFSPPRYLPHRNPWEVADVQWSPFASRENWVISTSNQKALVWNLAMRSWEESVELVLHGHTRAITDINFSAHHPDLLATCAVDSFIHCWDLRTPERPAFSFSDWFAGATQVKWCRQQPELIASSHDKYLRVWDKRMGAYPVRSIEAHSTKIYGIDWNRHVPDRIVTCSLDRTIKFWDCSNLEDIPERIIQLPFPAWRARHTPFGWGLLAMPQRGNGDLHLYDRRPVSEEPCSSPQSAVASFEGHQGQVKEFLWRPRGNVANGVDDRDFQLVTWGTDQKLRLHRLAPETLATVGYEKGVTKNPAANTSRRGALYKTFRDEPFGKAPSAISDSPSGSSPATGHSLQSRARRNTGVGMKKFTIPNPQSWLQGGTAISRIGMHGRKEARRMVNPIDWIKNVKVTSWSPDLFGEEIAQVNDKFGEVKFSSIEMSQRKAAVSLHGPWGDSGSLIFMEVDLKFPTGYPHDAAATFKIQKTSFMTDELCAMLSDELKLISSRYLERKRGCLEAAIRYLLREQDMEQILSWILDDTIEDSKMTEEAALPDDLSSDEDDGDVADFQGATGMINSTEILTANVLVPVPKGCGALWTSRGQLVCFFPPKPKHPTSFLDLVHSRSNDNDKNDRVFEGFGKLHAESPGAKIGQRNGSDGTQSPISDHSSSYSAASSQGSDVNISQPMSFYPRTNWRVGGFQRARSADQSTLSLAGQSKARMTGELGSEVIVIHDLSDMLPSRQDLASDYRLFGPPSEVCAHNSDVALKHGLEDIALIWRLVRMILWGHVPLKSHKGSPADPLDVLLIARSATESLRDTDSGVDVSYDVDHAQSRARGRVRWGQGIFGSTYLIPALFAHFEGLGDVQMLAMLTCIFAEPNVPGSQTASSAPSLHQKAPAFSVDYYPSMGVARSVRDQLLMVSFAVTNPSRPALESTEGHRRDSVMQNTPLTPHSTGTTPPVQKSASDPPREKRHTSRTASADIKDYTKFESGTPQTTAISMSSSPNQGRLPYRAGVNALVPVFSNSPPKPISSSGTKRSSPIGSLVGQHVNAAAVGWAAAGFFGGPSSKAKSELVGSAVRGRRSSARSSPLVSKSLNPHSLSSEGDPPGYWNGSTATTSKRGQSAVAGPKTASDHQRKSRVKTKSTLYNQTLFDEDGYSTVPLLDPSLRWRFRAYRAAYAAILGVWGMHTQRTEILKFDNFPTLPALRLTVLKEAKSDQSTPDEAVGLGLTRRTTLNPTRTATAARRGLEIRRICHQCNELLVPIEKNGIPIGWHCQGVCAYGKKGGSTRTICTICSKSIFGVIVPCVHCGHLICFDCLQAWVARKQDQVDEAGDEEDFDPVLVNEMSCPTGCGCTCSIYRAVKVIPQTPGARAIQQVMKREEDNFDFNAPSTAIPDAATDVISPKAAATAVPSFYSLSRVRSDLSARAESDRGSRRGASSYFSMSMSEAFGDDPSGSAAISPGPRVVMVERGLGSGSTAAGMLPFGQRGSEVNTRRESEAQATLRKAGIMYNV